MKRSSIRNDLIFHSISTISTILITDYVARSSSIPSRNSRRECCPICPICPICPTRSDYQTLSSEIG
jgi:hypothetical protein